MFRRSTPIAPPLASIRSAPHRRAPRPLEWHLGEFVDCDASGGDHGVPRSYPKISVTVTLKPGRTSPPSRLSPGFKTGWVPAAMMVMVHFWDRQPRSAGGRPPDTSRSWRSLRWRCLMARGLRRQDPGAGGESESVHLARRQAICADEGGIRNPHRRSVGKSTSPPSAPDISPRPCAPQNSPGSRRS